MREIKFRGKDIKDGEWIIGYYSPANIPILGCIGHFINQDGYRAVEIDQRTVGQFTGMKDENGKEIFEGDIVEFETEVACNSDKEIKPFWKDCYVKSTTVYCGFDIRKYVRKDQGIVQWNSTAGMFDLKVYNNGRYKRKAKLFVFRVSGYKVIGNIHDNPELVGGVK